MTITVINIKAQAAPVKVDWIPPNADATLVSDTRVQHFLIKFILTHVLNEYDCYIDLLLLFFLRLPNT